MEKQRILFIDRDGTLIEEPADEQIDSFEKLRFVPGVFSNLGYIHKRMGFRFVMVTNQDGLGTPSFPEETFWPVHRAVLLMLTIVMVLMVAKQAMTDWMRITVRYMYIYVVQLLMQELSVVVQI